MGLKLYSFQNKRVVQGSRHDHRCRPSQTWIYG